MAAGDSIGCLVRVQSYRPIGANETGKITRGGHKKMMAEGLDGILAVGSALYEPYEGSTRVRTRLERPLLPVEEALHSKASGRRRGGEVSFVTRGRWVGLGGWWGARRAFSF